MGRNIDQHHIANNKAKAELHMGWNKISIRHLDKLGMEPLTRRFVDNIEVVAERIAVAEIVAVAEIAVDNYWLQRLGDKPLLPLPLELVDKNNQGQLFADPSLAQCLDQNQPNCKDFRCHIYHLHNLIKL